MDISQPHPLRSLLLPAAAVYGGIVRARRALYDRRILTTHPSPRFAISVGGIEAGGSGKTPVTAYILRQLFAAGRRPALLSRGYGRQSKGLVLRKPGEAAHPGELGDEPAMLLAELAAEGYDFPIAAVGRRALGAAALAPHCDALVLDDAFSHRGFARHVDIVVLRGEAPFGNGRLLPSGSLREPPDSLRRAHVIWLHYRHNVPPAAPPAWVHKRAPQALCIMSHAVPTSARRHCAEGPKQAAVQLAGARVVGAAGIARPGEFEAALKGAGAHVAAFHAYADHHAFTPADVARLRESLTAHAAQALVVTPKDAIKLAALWSSDAALWMLGTDVRITFNECALRQIIENPANR